MSVAPGEGGAEAAPALACRPLGRTGFESSRIGAGDVADRTLGLEGCMAVLERAIERGVNVLDTAPSYEDGFSELVVGRVVRNHKRESLFVIDKIERPRAPVIPQLDSSIFRLRLDRIDLAVFHGISDLKMVDRLLAKGGSFDDTQVARREGLFRFLGASCHHPEVAERLIDDGRVEVLMFPIGPQVDPRYRPLIGRCRERGIGTVCFKTFAAGKLLGPTAGYGQPLPDDAPDEARRLPTRFDPARCLRYTLTLDPDVALLGMSTAAEVDAALDAVPDFTPMTAAELAEAEADAAREVAGKGPAWWNPA